MSGEKHHHGIVYHIKDNEGKPLETSAYEYQTPYEGGGYSETTGYSAEGDGVRYNTETTYGYGSAAPGGGQFTSKTTSYVKEVHSGGGGGRSSTETNYAYGSAASGGGQYTRKSTSTSSYVKEVHSSNYSGAAKASGTSESGSYYKKEKKLGAAAAGAYALPEK